MSYVLAALTAKYCAPAWATMFEVSNDAGQRRSRSADMIAMSCWPSRGLHLHGFEIKTSRRDWLRELNDPAKAEPILRYCDRWWIAVADDEIVKDGELPPTWGMQVLRKNKLVEVVPAPPLEAAPMDRGFLAALLRRAGEDMVPKSAVAELVQKRLDDRRESNEAFQKQLTDAWQKRAEAAEQRERALAAALEMDLYDVTQKVHGGKLGPAVRHVMNGGMAGELRALEALAERTREIAQHLDNVAAGARGAVVQTGEERKVGS